MNMAYRFANVLLVTAIDSAPFGLVVTRWRPPMAMVAMVMPMTVCESGGHYKVEEVVGRHFD